MTAADGATRRFRRRRPAAIANAGNGAATATNANPGVVYGGRGTSP
jgi:hypothetical protein